MKVLLMEYVMRQRRAHLRAMTGGLVRAENLSSTALNSTVARPAFCP